MSGTPKSPADGDRLAVNGGSPVRSEPMPPRRLFGEDELDAVKSVFERAWRTGQDFGYQGSAEQEYTEAFSEFQGGGFADGVSSGTAAIHVALRALQLDGDAEVVVSPITDPGSVAPVLLQGHKLGIADAGPGHFNVNADTFRQAVSRDTEAAILTHTAGYPLPMPEIQEVADDLGIAVIEDCSQAHGAAIEDQRVGTFGALAAFSTMFSKQHSTGGCGGLVYTQEKELYDHVRSLADRGKPFHEPDFDPRDPSENRYPALNHNLDALSAAIGRTTLRRLDGIIERRARIASRLRKRLDRTATLSVPEPDHRSRASYFYLPVRVRTTLLESSKCRFAEALEAEGVWLNPHYRYVVSEWSWVQEATNDDTVTPNAVNFRDSSFNILFHEAFEDGEVRDIVEAAGKVERAFLDGGAV